VPSRAFAGKWEALVSGHPENTGLGRMLARRRQTTSASVWRNPASASGKRAGPTLHTAAILVHIVAPNARALQLLADWGVQKADMLAELAYDADVIEADELHIGSVIYQVERAVKHDTLTLCAVWLVRGAVPIMEIAGAGFSTPLWLLGIGSLEGATPSTGGGFRSPLPPIGLSA